MILIRVSRFHLAVAFAIVLMPLGLRAQDPNLAPANLKYTKEVVDANHLIVQAALQMESDRYVRFRYDRYPDNQRITTDDGVAYAQLQGKPWLISKDWGKTGTPVKPEKVRELENYVGFAELPMAQATSLDKSQGDTIWKSIDQTKKGEYELFTYERTRENPKPNGVYPRYTFIKYKNDTDGKLLLEHFSAQVRSGEKLVPVEIKFDFMLILPEGSVTVEPAPGKPQKK